MCVFFYFLNQIILILSLVVFSLCFLLLGYLFFFYFVLRNRQKNGASRSHPSKLRLSEDSQISILRNHSRLTLKPSTPIFHSELASLKQREMIMPEKLAKRSLRQLRITLANFSLRLKLPQMRFSPSKMLTTLPPLSSMTYNCKTTWQVQECPLTMNWYLP